MDGGRRCWRCNLLTQIPRSSQRSSVCCSIGYNYREDRGKKKLPLVLNQSTKATLFPPFPSNGDNNLIMMMLCVCVCSYKVQRSASRLRGSDTRLRQGDPEGRPGGLLVRQENGGAQGHAVSGLQRDSRAQLSWLRRLASTQETSARHRRLAPGSKS